MMRNATPAAEWVDILSITPWDKNPRKNDAAVDEVVKSINRFGFGAPILARSADRVVIAGHTRLKAALKIGLDKVPVRFLDLDPGEANALALADNRLGELADWDDEALAALLREMDADGTEMDGLGWSDDELREMMEPDGDLDGDSATSSGDYTTKIQAPIYTPKGTKPAVSDLVDRQKAGELMADIEKADIPDDVREFLVAAAARHNSFHYQRIAEYYCHAPAHVQGLMERSALVIIDLDQALENGFVRMTQRLADLSRIEEDGSDA